RPGPARGSARSAPGTGRSSRSSAARRRGTARGSWLEHHAVAHGDRPPTAGPRLPEPIPHGELSHVAVYRAGRAHAQREPHIAPQPGRLVSKPGAAIVDVRGTAEAH